MSSPPHDHSEGDDDNTAVLLNPRREIKRFLRDVETPGTFAVGSSLLAPAADLTVEGLGNIPLPLSKEGVGVLRGAAELAPFGHGAETKVDESVRRAWQIDGAMIGLSKEFGETVGRHALRAAEKLGLRARALCVEARLYKLVMYETGGHFRPHKDTEKEAGMFGTLVVQLPTAEGHEGGTLVVCHRGKQELFAWDDPDGSYYERASSARAAAAGPATVQGEAGGGVARSTSPSSSLPVRCAAFYGDCEHELLPVTRGVRLCLLYNLVRTTPGPPPVAAVGQEGSVAQLRLADAMAAWGCPGSEYGTSKFILPLEHEYTKASLSFGGLKGRDRAVADALRACREVDIYLAHVVKHESGTAEGQYGYGRGGGGCSCASRKRVKKCYYDSDYDGEDVEEEEEEEEEEEDYCDGYCDGYYSGAEDQTMDYGADVETTVTAKNWVGSDDKAVHLNLHIDIESEVVDCDEEDRDDDDIIEDAYYDEEEAMELLFPPGAEPDKREYEGYTGNYSPSLEFWYHRSVLILWPASATMRTALGCGAGTALSVARQRSARYGAADSLPLADLAMIVSLATGSSRGFALAKDAAHAAGVLTLCTGAGAGALDSSRRFLRVLAGGAKAAVGTPGLGSEGVAGAVAVLVGAVGWPAVGDDVVQLAKACNLEQGGHVALLARSLSTLLPQQQPQQSQQQQQQLHQDAAAGGASLSSPSSSSSSAGALIASTYANGVASDPDALERVTAKGAAGIVRLLLLPCCSGNASGDNPALQSFASVGSVRLQTNVLAAAIHEFRGQLEGNASAGNGQSRPPSCHSSAAVTLATGLTSRGFCKLGAAAVKNVAEDMLWLAARADGAGGLEQEFAGALLTGVRSGDPARARQGQEQLQAVLKSEIVQAAVRGDGGGGGGIAFWRALASERLAKVEAHSKPVMSWRQPNAELRDHPQVQQFLRGPERQMTYTRSGTFSNIAHARNFANKYFSGYYSASRNLSATCYAQGRGRGAYVTITKKTEIFDKKLRAYNLDKAEAVVLRALLSSSHVNNNGSTMSSGRVGDSSAGSGSTTGGGGGAKDNSGGASGFGRTPLGTIARSSGNAVGGVASVGGGEVQVIEEVIDLCDSP